MRFLRCIVFGLAFLGASCRHESNASRVKEFLPTPDDLETETVKDFKLSRVADIPQTIERASPEFDEELAAEDDQFDPFGADHKVWRVSFGKITADQFVKLQTTYYKNPQLSYDSTRSYTLVDFMPPQIQALSGLRFQSETINVDIPAPVNAKGKKPSVQWQTLSNCWNMSFEVLRADPKTTEIFYIDPEVAAKFYSDPQYFDTLSTYGMEENLADVAQRNKGLKPFDQMLVYSEGQLLHVATYIDQDFFFEKTGPDDLLNYRFTKYSEIAETYLTWDDTKIVFVRFKPQPLPKAEELFSMKARGETLPAGLIDEDFLARNPDFLSRVTKWFPPGNWQETSYRTFFAVAEVPLEYDAKKGRYKLEASAFKAVLQKPKFQ